MSWETLSPSLRQTRMFGHPLKHLGSKYKLHVTLGIGLFSPSVFFKGRVVILPRCKIYPPREETPGGREKVAVERRGQCSCSPWTPHTPSSSLLPCPSPTVLSSTPTGQGRGTWLGLVVWAWGSPLWPSASSAPSMALALLYQDWGEGQGSSGSVAFNITWHQGQGNKVRMRSCCCREKTCCFSGFTAARSILGESEEQGPTKGFLDV